MSSTNPKARTIESSWYAFTDVREDYYNADLVVVDNSYCKLWLGNT